MLKKSLLSLAVTTSLVGLAGCDISSTTDNTGTTPEVQLDSEAAVKNKVYPLFDPANSVLPVGIDLLFADASDTDGTANVGAEQGNPVKKALNDMDGISTLAPLDVQFNNPIDPDSAVAGSTVFLIKLPNAASVGGSTNLILPDGLDASSVDALNLATIAPFFTTTKADGSAADDSAFAAGTGLPESVAALNLFGANDGIPFGSPAPAPTQTDGILAAQPVAGVDYQVTVVSLDGGTNNTIRISPLKPLDGKTKYIALVTGSVKDTSGENISASPDYEAVRGTDDLVSPSLAPVRALVQNIEALSTQIITSGGSNLVPVANGIAFSAPFTTTDPTMVLKSMADPGHWAPAVITNNTIADAVITAGGIDPTGVADGAKIATAIVVARGALTAANPSLNNATAYEHPRARSVETILAAANTALRLTPAQITASFDTPLTEDVLVGQGAIELPQYTAKFDAADTTTFSDIWNGNTVVGAVLDGALGNALGTTPPSDKDGSKNVTYRFPFAMEKRKAVVPFLTFEPQAGSTGPGNAGCTKPGAGWPVVIMQHGFTSDRTGNLINGIKVADLTCHAVIAMDLPHHGIAPTNDALALNVDYVHTTDPSNKTPFAAAIAATVATATAAGQAALDATILDELEERHEGFYGSGGVPTPVTYADDPEVGAVGDSGSLWIRLDNFQRTRDNMRQGVMDLLNLNASLGSIDLDGDAAADLDTDEVNYIGHSLGAIVGSAFIAVNNQSSNTNLFPIDKAVLATPGGHLTKLIENSVGIGGDIIAGLGTLGINQGSSSFESFMKVFQSTIDSADAMNFVSELSADGVNIPTVMLGMYGDLQNGTPGDLVVPINGNGIQISADTYVLADGSTNQPKTAQNPLTGLDPMLALIGAENIKDTPTGTKYVAKYNEGGHSTFSSAGTGGTGAPNFDSATAYAEMLNQTVTLLLTGTPAVNNGGVLISDAP
jgi:pimeloyl-ACP methyl ester carboxylesterase